MTMTLRELYVAVYAVRNSIQSDEFFHQDENKTILDYIAKMEFIMQVEFTPSERKWIMAEYKRAYEVKT